MLFYGMVYDYALKMLLHVDVLIHISNSKVYGVFVLKKGNQSFPVGDS